MASSAAAASWQLPSGPRRPGFGRRARDHAVGRGRRPGGTLPAWRTIQEQPPPCQPESAAAARCRGAGQGSGRGVRRPVSRVLSTRARGPAGMAIHLGRALLHASRDLPGCGAETRPGQAGARPVHPYLVLLPVGFAMPVPLPVPRWALTPPFHPYLRFPEGGLLSVALSVTRYAFARACPGVTWQRVQGARTFLGATLVATRSSDGTSPGNLALRRQ